MTFDGSRAEFYRARAVDMRAFADKARDLDIKQQFEMIAREYERLAIQVESGILGR